MKIINRSYFEHVRKVKLRKGLYEYGIRSVFFRKVFWDSGKVFSFVIRSEVINIGQFEYTVCPTSSGIASVNFLLLMMKIL